MLPIMVLSKFMTAWLDTSLWGHLKGQNIT